MSKDLEQTPATETQAPKEQTALVKVLTAILDEAGSFFEEAQTLPHTGMATFTASDLSQIIPLLRQMRGRCSAIRKGR